MTEPEPATTPTDLLYHYTDANALKSIVEYKQLWASEALFLNDSQEVVFGIEHIIKQLEPLLTELKTLPQGPEERWSFQVRVAEYILDKLRGLREEPNPSARVYVACFCGEPDLLSQWRSYGRGGYAIGFRKSALEDSKLALAPDPDPEGPYRGQIPPKKSLREVRYFEKPDIDVMDDYSARAIVEITMHGSQRDAPFIRVEANALTELATIKDRAFREEKEWRLVTVVREFDPTKTLAIKEVVRPQVKFRTSPVALVPYIEVGFSSNAIAEVRVGPGGDQRLRLKAVRRLLDEFECVEAVVRPSAAPYRAV